jgi:hypothetical protein
MICEIRRHQNVNILDMISLGLTYVHLSSVVHCFLIDSKRNGKCLYSMYCKVKRRLTKIII